MKHLEILKDWKGHKKGDIIELEDEQADDVILFGDVVRVVSGATHQTKVAAPKTAKKEKESGAEAPSTEYETK